MNLIRHCIVDTKINEIVNIIEYETEINGIPLGLDENLLCFPSNIGDIGDEYINNEIILKPVVDVTPQG